MGYMGALYGVWFNLALVAVAHFFSHIISHALHLLFFACHSLWKNNNDQTKTGRYSGTVMADTKLWQSVKSYNNKLLCSFYANNQSTGPALINALLARGIFDLWTALVGLEWVSLTARAWVCAGFGKINTIFANCSGLVFPKKGSVYVL